LYLIDVKSNDEPVLILPLHPTISRPIGFCFGLNIDKRTRARSASNLLKGYVGIRLPSRLVNQLIIAVKQFTYSIYLPDSHFSLSTEFGFLSMRPVLTPPDPEFPKLVTYSLMNDFLLMYDSCTALIDSTVNQCHTYINIFESGSQHGWTPVSE
jgi:hypothetical protein